VLVWRGRWSAHGKLLAKKFLKPSDKRGIGYREMKEAEAGEAMEMMCPTCLTPRDPEKKKCLFCKSTEEAVHFTQPMASMMVDGKLWELRFEADGAYHCEARRKRRMPPWWMFRTWPNHHRPAWIQSRPLLLTKCHNPSASSSGNRW